MERDLIKFNKNITKVTKEIAKYEDEKGNYMLIPTGQLLCNVEYMELDEISYKKALFEMIIDKDVEYNKITITKPVDKYTKTKNEKDKGTIIEAEVEVSQVWVVKNGLGLTKAYNVKKEALKLVEELNNKYLEMAELK
ncbi:MAG: hypothetical protein SOV25_00510 [Candidatus Onthovivens sp.]|nr:hypothetical protein [Candidatus Onthovivens sp.]